MLYFLIIPVFFLHSLSARLFPLCSHFVPVASGLDLFSFACVFLLSYGISGLWIPAFSFVFYLPASVCLQVGSQHFAHLNSTQYFFIWQRFGFHEFTGKPEWKRCTLSVKPVNFVIQFSRVCAAESCVALRCENNTDDYMTADD